jgi:hypothetical protein
MTSLRYFAHDASRLSSHNGEAGDDHVGWNDRVVQNPYIVLNDGELTDSHVLAHVDVRADGRGLNNGTFANEDVIAQAERHVRECSAVWGSVHES